MLIIVKTQVRIHIHGFQFNYLVPSPTTIGSVGAKSVSCGEVAVIALIFPHLQL